MNDIRVWFFSAVAAFISGAAMGILVMKLDPEKFNFQGGIGNLVAVMGLSGILKVAAYLAESPLPKGLLSTVVTKTDSIKSGPGGAITTTATTKTEITEQPQVPTTQV